MKRERDWSEIESFVLAFVTLVILVPEVLIAAHMLIHFLTSYKL